MPVNDETNASRLLAEGLITAITVDTNIFVETGLQLNSPNMQALIRLKEIPFSFVLSQTVSKEILSHLEKRIDEAIRNAEAAVGKALAAFETENPSKDEIITQISGGRAAKESAEQILRDFISDSACVTLNDENLVSTSDIFASYFEKTPPFGAGKKKNEFPDALALNALETSASNQRTSYIVVSKDSDWRAFCERSDSLYLIPEVERALALINNAPLGLRETVISWLVEDRVGDEEVYRYIERNVEEIMFTAEGYATAGQMEAMAWMGELKGINWPSDDKIDIIEIDEDNERGGIRVIISLPVSLAVMVPIELSFSIWDGIDKESIDIGSRTIEFQENIGARATLTLQVFDQGANSEEVAFEESELNIHYYEIELGEIDTFEENDYEDIDQEDYIEQG